MLKLMNILALDKQKKLKKQDAMGTSDITNYLLHHSVLNVNLEKFGLSYMHQQNTNTLGLTTVYY